MAAGGAILCGITFGIGMLGWPTGCAAGIGTGLPIVAGAALTGTLAWLFVDGFIFVEAHLQRLF